MGDKRILRTEWGLKKSPTYFLGPLLILVIPFLPGTPCFSQTPPGKEATSAKALTQISWSAADDSVRVQMKGDGFLQNYSVLELSDPPRLVLDFPGMGNATGKSEIPVGHRLLNGIRIGKHPEKARVVFEFPGDKFPHKRIEKRGDSLIILFSREIPKEESPPGKKEELAEDRGKAPGPAAKAQGLGPGGGKISLVFQEADIREVIEKIAEAAQRNLTVSDAVQGKITLRLIDVPWQEALDIIIRNRNLAIIREGDALRIITQEEYEQKMK